jgi:hypothetical protein
MIDAVIHQEAHAEAAVGVGEAYAPMVKIQKNMWLEWARVAIRHRAIAAGHRARAVLKEPEWPEALADEMRAGLVAIVAAGASFEALWNYLGQELMPREYEAAEKARLDRELPAPPPISKSVTSLLTLCLGKERVPKPLRRDIADLFTLRNAAVHPLKINDVPVLLPDFETSVGAEIVKYGLPAANWSVDDVMLKVWTMLLGEDVEDVAKPWVEMNSAHLPGLIALRAVDTLEPEAA